MPMELVRELPYDHPYRWDGTLFGGPRLWRPSNIGSSLALWLDAEDASTITLNGSTVSQWNDKSGNGRHLAQAVAVSQPTFTANAVGGKPALVFDGSNDFMVGVSDIGISGSPLFSIAAVWATPIAINRVFMSWGSSAPASGFHYMNSNVSGDMWTGFSGFNQTGTTTPASPSSAHVLTIGRNSTTTSDWVITQNGNNLAVTQNNNTPITLVNGPLNLGRWVDANLWSAITAAEIVITSSSLSVGNRQRLEGYLAWKWGLEANLPADHPYKLLPPTV